MGRIGSDWEVSQTNDTTDRDSNLTFYTNLNNSITEKMRITSSGDVGIGTTSPNTALHVVGTIKIADGAETCTIAANAGMIRYTGGNLQYCNGSAWQTLGISGAGLTTLGGQTGSSQTFASGTAGTAPAITSASNVHTLNIPLASTAGVTSGTITKAQYDSFAAKLSAVAGSTLNSAQFWVGSGTNLATAVTMSGDATMSNTGALTIAANAVDSSMISADTIVAADIATGGVATAEILDGTIATADIADGAVTNAKIGTVGVEKVVNGAGNYFAYRPNNVACTNGQNLSWDNTNSRWICANDAGATDHGALTGLTDDDHTQYVRLAGRAGGQTLYGGTAASNNLTIDSTSHATKGDVLLLPTGVGSVGIGTTVPSMKTEIFENGGGVQKLRITEGSVGGESMSFGTGTTASTIAFSNTGDFWITGQANVAANPTAPQFMVGSTGNVGIGTSNPLNKLHVAGNTYIEGAVILPDASFIRSDDSAGSLKVYGGTSNTSGAGAQYFGSTSASNAGQSINTFGGANGLGSYVIRHRGTSAFNTLMTILPSGNLGLGTSNPSSIMHVVGDTAIYEKDLVNNTAFELDFRKNRGGAIVASGDGIGALDFLGYDGAADIRAAFIGASVDGTPGLNDMPGRLTFFTTADGTATSTERMRIDNIGDVGIGTTAPDSKLHIFKASAGTVASPNADGLTIENNTTATLSFLSPNTVANQITFGDPEDSNVGSIIYNHAANDLSFVANNAERVVILSTGNVGIGVATPSHILHINAQGRSTNAAWATTSDIRLKDIKGKYQHGLDEILKIKTVKFNYKHDNPLKLPSDKTHTGIIAQELQKIIPEAVEETDDGYLTVNNDPVHWAVVNAIQELHGMCKMDQKQKDQIQARIDKHEKELSRHTREIASIKTENEKLKAAEALKNQKINKLEKENAEIKARLDKIEKMLMSE